jgi:beta-carotene ketolase (CrtO type)
MTFDALVVGAGHNGLTCAAYLARAGKRVLVLEALPDVGGMAYTKELPGAPGYRVSPCAVDFDFFTMPNSVTDELELHRYGLKLTAPDPWGCYVNTDGDSLAFWRSIERTTAEMARFSRRDAQRYQDLMETLLGFVRVALPYLQGNPLRPGAKTVGEILWRTVRERKHLAKAARILAASPRQILEERFEREEVKAPFAVLSTLSMLPLDAPATNFGLLFGPFMHGWGLRRGEGGTGALTQALAAYVLAHGGEIRSGAGVHRIMVGPDGAEGVVLDSGEEIRARHVVAAVDPMTLLTRLLDEQHLPLDTRDELRGASIYGYNISHFKVDLAVRRMPTLRGQTSARSSELLNGVLLHANSLDSAHRALTGHANGEHSEDDPFMIVVPSVGDRALVPPDGGDVLYLWGVCPFEPRGVGWDEQKKIQTDRWIKVCDGYAPGFASSIIAHETQAPPDFITKYGGKGHLYHVDMTPSQLGPWRPIPSLAGYRTPVERLWHSGAGAHPMPGINGYSGRSTARAVLKAGR